MIENPVVRLKHPLNKILRYRNESLCSATLHYRLYWFDLDKSKVRKIDYLVFLLKVAHK